jgi:phosphatidylserine/phosphatidylglycerophosphate/cardiolipin synthase-like enzyme
VRSHFRKQRLYISDIDDIFEHCKRLASIAHRIQQKTPDYSPIRGLLEAHKQAKRFIHINSWGISREFLMALKLVAQDIPVRGIISLFPNQNWLLAELHNYKNEAPNLQIKTVCASSHNWDKLPHQKLIVIDGLLAFRGSANLTLAAWRKAQWDYDEVEVVTDVEKVINLHNRYFSSVWAKLSDYGEAIAIANNLIDNTAA